MFTRLVHGPAPIGVYPSHWRCVRALLDVPTCARVRALALAHQE